MSEILVIQRRSLSLLILFTLSVLLPAQRSTAQSSGILREVWFNMPGNTVADLTNNPAYPDNPSEDEVITDYFETPTNIGDEYAQRLRALITAPETGNYEFWIASDDASQLFISTNENPANRQLVAWVNLWTSSRQWTKEANQHSASVPLVAGQRYYIEALMKEQTGGDNLAVRWRLPSGQIEEPIPASRCVPFGLGPPMITSQPTNVTIFEGGSASFQVSLARAVGATYQWKRYGTNIPGATSSVFTITGATGSDNGSPFYCAITNSSGWTNSTTATLFVLADTIRPTIISAGNLGDSSRVTVLFSEPVEQASATKASNYSLDRGATVSVARFAGDDRSILLETSPLTPGLTYALTVNNVRDRATSPNSILPGTVVPVTTAFSPLDVRYIIGTNEPPGPSSRHTGLAITEVMYHPAKRSDGRNLEFIEVYNSNPWPEDLGGYRISGNADFTFPQGTTIPSHGYRVIAPRPADIAAVYGLDSVLGPLTNSTVGNTTNVLDNGGGMLRLRDEIGTVLLEVNYNDQPPWPVSPDGAGHSLVLARASYGEGDWRAWAASDRIGGSPGAADVPTSNPLRTILINEVLAHTDPPFEDFVELYNYSSIPLNLAGCVLTDDPETNRFVIPEATVIPAMGRLAFTQTQLGYALDATGETIYFKAADGARVVDALRFKAQENGVAFGRYPDGAPEFRRLSQPTLGDPNARPLLNDVVISEINYHSVTEDDNQEFVEIHNRGTGPVNLAGWGLSGGIDFTFPAGASVLPGGYAVVARSLTNFFLAHPALNPALVVGQFSGGLGNGGDVVRLTEPDDVVSTNELGHFETNHIHIVVDEVSYGTGGRWGRWADGGGSSLERTDSRAYAGFASSWADSEEGSKSAWTTVEFTGVLDNGAMAQPDQFQMFLLGAGECLVDNVEVIAQGGGNVVVNGTFDSNADGWFLQGTHQDSYWQPTGGYSGGCLHVVASDRGDTGANRIRTVLSQTLSQGSTATLRARVRWLKGHPEILLRLHGNWLEAPGALLTTANFGSPGAQNSQYRSNAGPAITSVSHWPVLPAAFQPVTVTARIDDPDGLASATLTYRVDPATNTVKLPLTYRGAGLFSATIPGQAAGVRVAFYLESHDAGTTSAGSLFPNDAPVRECLVSFGEPAGLPMLGTYRLWVSATNVARWNTRQKQSNHPLDATFVYGDSRVCYNAGTLYSGSPWHTPGYNGPLGNACDYELNLASDDQVLGADDFVFATAGNLNSDASYQAEQTAFWIGRKLGAPYMYRRHIRVFFNGQQRGNIYEDAQQPGREVVTQYFPNDDDGSLHKIEDWFEFDDSGDNKTGNVDATLESFTTTGGAKKVARYRWNWRPRGVRESANDFTNLFALVDAVNAAQPEPYRSQVANLMDVQEWTRILAMERIVGNWDSIGYNRGKNMYAYKPESGKWTLLPWDIDFVFNVGGDPPTTDLFGGNAPMLNRLRNFPEFQRAYWRAFQDAVNGPLEATTFANRVDAIYNGLTAAGVGPNYATTEGLKTYAASRRNYLISRLDSVAAEFMVNSSSSFSTNRNLIALTGTAPVGIATIKVNGVATQPSWTSVTEWTLNIVLHPGLNNLLIEGFDSNGMLVTGASSSLLVNFTGSAEPEQGSVVFSEVMYNPAVSDAEFIEIHNTATNTAFDLSNCRIQGVDFEFPQGTILPAAGYLLVVKDLSKFLAAFGSQYSVAGVYPGNLDNGGETLRLIRPGVIPDQDLIIDEFTYSDDAPWPVAADGFGSSLQLIDSRQDNGRIANWTAVMGGPSSLTNSLIGITDSWKYNQSGADLGVVWRQPAYNDNAWPSGAALLCVEDATLPAPKNTTLTYTSPQQITFYFRKTFQFTGDPAATTLSARLIVDDGAIVYINGVEVLRVGIGGGTISYSDTASRTVNNATYEGPFVLSAASLVQGDNVIAVEVHQINDTSSDIVFGMTLDSITASRAPYTPGSANSIATTLPPIPPLWLNEIESQNLTGIQDRFGERDPWLEIYNAGTSSISLTNLYLADNYTNLTRWAFPAGSAVNPGEFKLVWLDGQPGQTGAGELHAGFTVPPAVGSVALVQVANNRTSVVDYLNYNLPVGDRSYGAFPDGTPARRTRFYIPTPGAPNTNGYPEVPVVINEWMAGNTDTVPDPQDGEYSDWFELYNSGGDPVDLSGFTLTDDLDDQNKWTIPSGIIMAPGEFLRVWADGQPGQNGTGTDLHADFKLSLDGETIGLFAPNGFPIASVTFGPQTNDISEGFWPDGGANRYFMPDPTPGEPNQIPNQPNNPPVLALIGDRTIDELSLLSFTVAASDPDAQQALTYSLDAGAPAGAAINPESGLFTWMPGEAQGPGTHSITIRVTDNGPGNLSDTETITVTVHEVNAAPVLHPIGNRNVNQLSLLTFTATASDVDEPPNTLTFSLDEGAPAGAIINPTTGVFSWTPSAGQAPGTYSATIVVSDDGVPSLNSAETISISVNEAGATNHPPQLEPIPNVTLLAGRMLAVTNVAIDSDVPPQVLSYQLVSGPPGVSLNPATGRLSWRPRIDQAGTTNTIEVRVADNGSPSLSDTQTFLATVLVPAPPMLMLQAVSNGMFSFQVTGDEGPDYIIESSQSAGQAQWLPLSTNFAPVLPFTWFGAASNSLGDFYRVRLAP